MTRVWIVIYRESKHDPWTIWENRKQGADPSWSLFSTQAQANDLLEDVLDNCTDAFDGFTFETIGIQLSDLMLYFA